MDQAKLYEFEMLKQHTQQIQQHRQQFEMSLQEAEGTLQALRELTDTNKEGVEVVLPLGSGIVTKANLKNERKVLWAVGADILVEKDIEEISKILEKSINENMDMISKLDEQLMEIDSRLKELSEELQKQYEEEMKKGKTS